jgi:hypothetical protein
MSIVQRFFRQSMPDDGAGNAKSLTDYIDKRVVVILGGPGIGKTTELKQAKGRQADAIFSTVSQFLADPIESYQGKIIYLDALDEYRAELDQGKSIIDRIRGRLIALGCPKVRISCRGEEWQQGSDVKSLGDVAGGEPVYILKMQPLSEDDIRAIALEKINNVDTFLAGARERQLEEQLGNPETLKLYLEVYKKSGRWPETRAELMEQSTALLISEENSIHERARGDAIGDKRLMQAAEDLSAIILFGDKKGVALSKVAASDKYIPLQELPNIDLDAARVVARRRLFSSDKPEQVYPQHKTTGDYLAAKALVRRIKDKSLPLCRVLSLLTGKDGGPLSHMRDVYAWLIALLPNYAERLIEADPFGALIYGDAGQWLVPTRRTALKLLSAYAANNDPWFRADAWYAPLLGGLAHPELIENFRNILKNEPNPHVSSVVLSALEHGRPLPELGDDLLSFIRDPGRPRHDWLKDNALRTFIRICPERIGDCRGLLKGLEAGDISDDDHMLRAALLGKLYPSEIGPREVVHYFSKPKTNISGPGTMDWFIRHELVENTPDSDLPVLADAILTSPDDLKKLGEFNRKELNGALVRRLLEVHGNTATPEQIYKWLGIYMDRRHTVHLDKDDSDVIRDYLNTHSQLYVNLFRHWLDQTAPDIEHGYRFHHYDFRSRVLDALPPINFPETLLTWAAAETVSDRAEFLFEEAVDLIMRGDVGAFSVSFESLFDYVETHPDFAKLWEQKRPAIDQSTQDYRKGREVKHTHNVNILTGRIEILRTGKDIKNLKFWAKIWFHQGGKSPLECLRQETNGEIASAMVEGFEALLRMDRPHTPTDIASRQCENQPCITSYPVLAGADILAARSPDAFLALPEANLKAALAYHLINPIGGNARDWDKKIMVAHPGLAGKVLAVIWRTELATGKKEHLTGSYVGRAEDSSTPVILNEIYILLNENPALPPGILEDFLKNILQHGDAEGLRPLVPVALANRRVRGESHTLWLAVAALLSPSDSAHKLDRKLRSRSRYVWAAHGILVSGAGTLMNGLKSVPQLQMSISILGKAFNNVPMFIGERVGGDGNREDAAQSIRGLINTLAGLATKDAAQAFEKLIADTALHEWHDYLRHSQAVQAKNLRDADFKRPTAQGVCTLLAGGPPISMKDFQSLAVDILDDIAADIHGGNDNKWKSFWILAGRGALDKPKIENDSRYAMLPWIEPYLISRDITIEPEAAAADQKRVDIRLTHAGTSTLPIEVKRDDNAGLWTAIQNQLQEFYANDPKTGGYGIYLVIWYGKGGKGCKTPPKSLAIGTPTTATELQAALEDIKPSQLFIVRVIDVSKPHD